jgi:hypothetical protein
MTIRDPAVGRIHARPDRRAYGMGLGVILVDDVYPAFPGDVCNASGYPFPMQYDVAEGVDIYDLVRADDKSHLLEPLLASARRLERIGCRAVVAECGYFAWFQRELAAAVRVPVFASSLVQVPLAQATVGPDQTVGVLVASGEHLRERHLTRVGVTPGTNYVVHGAMDGGRIPDFHSLWNADVRSDLPSASAGPHCSTTPTPSSCTAISSAMSDPRTQGTGKPEHRGLRGARPVTGTSADARIMASLIEGSVEITRNPGHSARPKPFNSCRPSMRPPTRHNRPTAAERRGRGRPNTDRSIVHHPNRSRRYP